MSSQSGSFDAALVNITGGGNGTITAVSQSASTQTATITGINVTSTTSMTLSSTAGFNSTFNAAGKIIVLTPNADGSAFGLTYSNGSSALNLAFIPLTITTFTSTSSITVAIPSSLGLTAAQTGNMTNLTSVIQSGFDSAPSITFTTSSAPTVPVGGTITLTSVTATGTNANFSKLTIPLTVTQSTANTLVVSNYVFVNSGTFTSATFNSPSAYSFSILYNGTGYTTGDTFIIRGLMLGGTSPTNDLTLVVTAGTVNGLPNAVSSLSLSGVGVSSGIISNSVTLEYPNNRTARDSSDITRILKERIIYNEKRTGTPIQPGKVNLMVGGRPQVNPAGVNHIASGNAEVLWIPQGNQYRLSYLKGKMGCGGGSGGVFNLNGPLSGS